MQGGGHAGKGEPEPAASAGDGRGGAYEAAYKGSAGQLPGIEDLPADPVVPAGHGHVPGDPAGVADDRLAAGDLLAVEAERLLGGDMRPDPPAGVFICRELDRLPAATPRNQCRSSSTASWWTSPRQVRRQTPPLPRLGQSGSRALPPWLPLAADLPLPACQGTGCARARVQRGCRGRSGHA